MSLENVLFIGTADPNQKALPLDGILGHYSNIRDAIALSGHYEPESEESLVAVFSFIFAFNNFKAMGLLLPELYYESASAVFRQLWEVSLNLHWVSLDASIRSSDFVNYTTMEYRRTMEKNGGDDLLADYDEATEEFQSRFRFRDRKGRDRIHRNFATTTVHDRARELGDPWKSEYDRLYHLSSVYAHGSPSAIMRGLFMTKYPNAVLLERNSTSLMAVSAVRVIVRDFQLMARMDYAPEPSKVNAAFVAFKTFLGERE